MTRILKSLVAMSLIATLAACASTPSTEEEVVAKADPSTYLTDGLLSERNEAGVESNVFKGGATDEYHGVAKPSKYISFYGDETFLKGYEAKLKEAAGNASSDGPLLSGI